MPTLYTRTFDLKESLTDAEVVEFWRFCVDELPEVIGKVPGTKSFKFYSGAGALRADLAIIWEMEDAAVYERAITDSGVRTALGKFYAAIDMRRTTQKFQREITSALVHALSG